MYPTNSIFKYWEISGVGTSTLPIGGKVLTLQTNYDNATPEYSIYCDGNRIYEQIPNAPQGISPLLPVFKECTEIQARINNAGKVDLYFSYTTTTPVYNVSTSVSSSSTFPQYTQGDFVTQLFLLILITATIFGGVYNSIVGSRTQPKYTKI